MRWRPFLVLGGLAVGACSGGPTSLAPLSSPPSVGSTTTLKNNVSIDPCKLVTRQEIEQAVGQPVKPPAPLPTVIVLAGTTTQIPARVCLVLAENDGHPIVQLRVAEESADRLFESIADSTTPVPDLGDTSRWQTNGTALWTRKAKVSIVVQIVGLLPQKALEAAKAITASVVADV